MPEIRFAPSCCYDSHRRGVTFVAEVDGRSVVCLLPTRTLLELCARRGSALGSIEELFERCRSGAERMARVALAQRMVPPEGLVLS